MRTNPTPLAGILAEQIKSRGRITFAEYMEACLYHPQFGYYTRADQSERRDYITSVDVTPLFGRLLARQFHEMWTLLGRPQPFTLVEAGAGAGRLAKQVLDCVRESLAEFYPALRYVAVERSAMRRTAQAKNLEHYIASERFCPREELPGEISCGCIFSNELFDAFAVHRVVMEKAELREIYVTHSKDGFSEELGPLSSNAILEYFDTQGIILREGQMAEVNLAACDWIEETARRLHRGFLLTVDYGHEAQQLYDERHIRGTLLAYDRHRASEEFYRAPGAQDLTSHVNFTALDLWGHRGGLMRGGFTSQTNFLLSLAKHSNFEDIENHSLSEHDKTAARSLFKTLIHPEGMGETFRVLVQHKGLDQKEMDGLRLAGFAPL
jgi:SAM-dependent MidA family methyltransferase